MTFQNCVTSGSGGALSVQDGTVTTAAQGSVVTFTNCLAASGGGALHVLSSQVALPAGVAFTSNEASLGGAMYIGAGADVTVGR